MPLAPRRVQAHRAERRPFAMQPCCQLGHNFSGKSFVRLHSLYNLHGFLHASSRSRVCPHKPGCIRGGSRRLTYYSRADFAALKACVQCSIPNVHIGSCTRPIAGWVVLAMGIRTRNSARMRGPPQLAPEVRHCHVRICVPPMLPSDVIDALAIGSAPCGCIWDPTWSDQECPQHNCLVRRSRSGGQGDAIVTRSATGSLMNLSPSKGSRTIASFIT